MKIGFRLVLALALAGLSGELALAQDGGSASTSGSGAAGGGGSGAGGGDSGLQSGAKAGSTDVDMLYGSRRKTGKGPGPSVPAYGPAVGQKATAPKPPPLGAADPKTSQSARAAAPGGSGAVLGNSATAPASGSNLSGADLIRPAARTGAVGGATSVRPGVLSGSGWSQKRP